MIAWEPFFFRMFSSDADGERNGGTRREDDEWRRRSTARICLHQTEIDGTFTAAPWQW